MGTLWIPGAEKLPVSSPGGTITSNAPPRVVWHTVEGTSGSSSAWASSIRTLNSKGAEPQVLYDPVTDRLGQFMPLNLSGRALKNDGATRTNRVGRACIQIEVVANSAKPFTGYWKPGPNFRALFAAIRSWGIPDVQPAGAFPVFIASPPHNVPENPRSRAIWTTKGGHYSHSQIPANDHGDPGGVSFPAMLAAASVKPPIKPPVIPPPVVPPKTTENEMTEAEYEDYNGRLYGPTGTLGIWHAQEVAYRTAHLAALQAQTTALQNLADALKPKV